MNRHVYDVIKGKKPLVDVIHYLVGHYRYKLYYNKYLQVLIRLHIFEQIKNRIKWMNETCYNQGSCIKCGCETTQLQMCNKSCEGLCYPSMMNRKQWKVFKGGGSYVDKNGLWLLDLKNNKLTLVP